MPRFKSMENLASPDSKQTSGSVQKQDVNCGPQQPPRPAPRRDVKSCVIPPHEQSDFSKTNPVSQVAPEKPPLPAPKADLVMSGDSAQEQNIIHKNYSSDSLGSNPLDDPVPLHSVNADDPFDTGKFRAPFLQPDQHLVMTSNQGKEAVASSTDPFDTSNLQASLPPAVPARPPVPNSIMNPFDASMSSTPFVKHPSPLVPNRPQPAVPLSSTSVCLGVSHPPMAHPPPDMSPPAPPDMSSPAPPDMSPPALPDMSPPALPIIGPSAPPDISPPSIPPNMSPPPFPPSEIPLSSPSVCPDMSPPPIPSGCPVVPPPPPPRIDSSNLPPPPVPRRPGSPSEPPVPNRVGQPPPVPQRVGLK